MGTSRLRRTFGLLLIVAALFASVASAEDDPEVLGGDDSPAATDGDEGGASSTTEAEEDEDEAPTTEAAEELELTVESGMTSGVNSIGTRHTSAGALVTNPNEGLAAYEVEVLFNLKDAGGTVLDSDSSTVPYIAPGATVPVAPLQIGFDLATEPASVEVVVTGDLREDEGWDGVEFMMGEGIELEVTGAAITAGSFGNELTAQVKNPSPDTIAEFATWDCVLKSGGAVVGGEGSGISDSIPPGVTVALSHSMSLDVAADEIICRAVA